MQFIAIFYLVKYSSALIFLFFYSVYFFVVDFLMVLFVVALVVSGVLFWLSSFFVVFFSFFLLHFSCCFFRPKKIKCFCCFFFSVLMSQLEICLKFFFVTLSIKYTWKFIIFFIDENYVKRKFQLFLHLSANVALLYCVFGKKQKWNELIFLQRLPTRNKPTSNLWNAVFLLHYWRRFI